MKVYYAPNTRAVRTVWLLNELGLAHELVRFKLGDKAMRAPEYLAVNPNGRVPTLEDGDVRISESTAIAQYLVARHGQGRLAPAVASPDFPVYLQWLHYAEGMIMPPVNTLVVETILLPPERRSEEILGQAKRLLTKSLEPLNAALAESDYMIGELSGVDFMLGHACYMARRLGCMPEDMTHLHAYVKRVEARPAFDKAIKT